MGGGSEKLTKQDLSRVYSIFGVRLSCSAIAKEVNAILARQYCCYRVSCASSDTNPDEISAGVTIDPFFQ
jgi:hypothetical protein